VKAGEIYVSNENDHSYASIVLMTLEHTHQSSCCYQTQIQCLVLFDDARSSLDDVGSTDNWNMYQLLNLFEKIT
jgi:hypothetical protein